MQHQDLNVVLGTEVDSATVVLALDRIVVRWRASKQSEHGIVQIESLDLYLKTRVEVVYDRGVDLRVRVEVRVARRSGGPIAVARDIGTLVRPACARRYRAVIVSKSYVSEVR